MVLQKLLLQFFQIGCMTNKRIADQVGMFTNERQNMTGVIVG